MPDDYAFISSICLSCGFTLGEFIPGMEASVELVGEKRSIAQYLTSPFAKMSSEAFREK